jgi:hypothetical protein
VKTLCADASVGFVNVKVGHCQALNSMKIKPSLTKVGEGFFASESSKCGDIRSKCGVRLRTNRRYISCMIFSDELGGLRQSTQVPNYDFWTPGRGIAPLMANRLL